MASDAGSGLAQQTQPQHLAAYELRITARCCRDDLGVDPDKVSVTELKSKWKIVGKFVDIRSSLPDGQEPFRSAPGSNVFTLHSGRQRGATWYDREYRVVWLLGFGTHREGDRDDSYNRIELLEERHQLMPTVEDYEALIRDRQAQLIPTMVAEVRTLLGRARSTPGQVHSTLLNCGVAVRLYVERLIEEDQGLEEFHLAISTKYLERRWLSTIRTALWPEGPNANWEFSNRFPVDSDGAEDELCFRHWHELAPETETSDG
jgi:hypothetical protein